MSMATKREKLIEAATTLIYQKGFRNTTLADTANISGVPLGNVYYYFKSKESLAKAVIESHKNFYMEQLTLLEKLPDPGSRLNAFLDYIEDMLDTLVEYGCPVGSLCQELDKTKEHIAIDANNLFKLQIEWLIKQYQKLGSDSPRDHAVEFTTDLQGATLMAHVLGDKNILLDRLHKMREKLTIFSVETQSI